MKADEEEQRRDQQRLSDQVHPAGVGEGHRRRSFV
jgi:hypothetical protein